MAAPSYDFTIARVAKMLGEDEALLEDIALMNIDPEDGRLTIIDLDDEVSTTAFHPVWRREPQRAPRRPQTAQDTRVAE